MSNWWEGDEWKNSKPMNFPDRSDGPTKPIKRVGPCTFPEDCKCKQRVHVAKCDCHSDVRFECKCSHGE